MPCAFEFSSRLNHTKLAENKLEEVSCPLQIKDYDTFDDQKPTSLATRYDMSNWGIFTCTVDGQLLGGTLLAPSKSEYSIPGATDRSAILIDLRVNPTARRNGIGTALLISAISWASTLECDEILVETQDTNVAACKFYEQMGFQLKSFELNAYKPTSDEARLIWTLKLFQH